MMPSCAFLTTMLLVLSHGLALDYASLNESHFSHVGEGYCDAVDPSNYPRASSASYQCQYADINTDAGLASKQACVKICAESFGVVQGIFLVNGKCGCCPGWDGSSIISSPLYETYKLAGGIVKSMTSLPPSPSPGLEQNFEFNFVGKGYCGKWHRQPTAECKYEEFGLRSASGTDVTRLSSCASQCVSGLAPLAVKGVFITMNLGCGCCLAQAEDGEEWKGQYEAHEYRLYNFTASSTIVI